MIESQLIWTAVRSHPPFGTIVRKLRNYSPQAWRYRIGAWRFFYEIGEEERIVCCDLAQRRISSCG